MNGRAREAGANQCEWKWTLGRPIVLHASGSRWMSRSDEDGRAFTSVSEPTYPRLTAERRPTTSSRTANATPGVSYLRYFGTFRASSKFYLVVGTVHSFSPLKSTRTGPPDRELSLPVVVVLCRSHGSCRTAVARFPCSFRLSRRAPRNENRPGKQTVVIEVERFSASAFADPESAGVLKR